MSVGSHRNPLTKVWKPHMVLGTNEFRDFVLPYLWPVSPSTGFGVTNPSGSALLADSDPQIQDGPFWVINSEVQIFKKKN